MNFKVPLLFLLLSAGLYYYYSPVPVTDQQLAEGLKGKVVLICGASSGIGEEVAYQLAKLHAKIVIVARRADRLSEVKEEALKLGAEAVEAVTVDFSDVAKAGETIDFVVEKFGKLDYLISNHASMAIGAFLATPYIQDTDYIQRMFKVNLFSHIELAVKALPHIEKSKGHMFFTSSLAGEIPFYACPLYGSTKHSMNGFFYSLQQELVAKESDASLTVGALGLIVTKDLAAVSEQMLKEQPEFAKGDLKECARKIIESYISRPMTMTYPSFAGTLTRAMLYFSSTEGYHNLMVNGMAGSKGKGLSRKEQYNVVQKSIEERDKAAKEINFQQGYGADWKDKN